MSAEEEEARALTYRTMMHNRAVLAVAREIALQGDPAARRALGEAWEPVANRHADPAEHELP